MHCRIKQLIVLKMGCSGRDWNSKQKAWRTGRWKARKLKDESSRMKGKIYRRDRGERREKIKNWREISHRPTQTVSFTPADVVGRKNCIPFGQGFILSLTFGYATFIFAKRWLFFLWNVLQISQVSVFVCGQIFFCMSVVNFFLADLQWGIVRMDLEL